MSEFIKCDGCGRMTKKKGDAAENWSVIAIKTCHEKGLFGDNYRLYHACPECRENVLAELSFSELNQAGGKEIIDYGRLSRFVRNRIN